MIVLICLELVRKMFVFLSHSSKDKDFVRRLAHDLEQEGIDVWIDEEGLHVGDNLSKILSKIKEATFIVVVMSLSAQQSDWVRREIDLARNMGNIRVLPILIEEIEGGWGGELARQAVADFRNQLEYRRYIDSDKAIADFFHISIENGNYVINIKRQLKAMEHRIWDIPDPKENANKRLTAGEAMNMAGKLLETDLSRQWQFGFISNTGVIEVYSGEPQPVSENGRKGFAYEFMTRKILS